MTIKSWTHNDYTVGWVCALPKELIAAAAMLDETHPDLPRQPNDHNAYTLGRVGVHHVVIGCLPKGESNNNNNNAATVATRMTSTFPMIKFGLMVGIGGGVPKSVRLGDVAVSIPTGEYGGVVQWDFGKTEQGGTFKRTGSLNRPPTELLTALTKLEKEHEMKGSKIPQYLDDLEKNWPRLVPKYIKSAKLKDVLFRADCKHVEKPEPSTVSASNNELEDNQEEYDEEEDEDEEAENENKCSYCDQTKIVRRKPRDMRVCYGLIASGNQVIKDAAFRDEINARLGGKVLCFEMEAAGLMNDFPCIVIRGICDYADAHKNKDWQEHAAAVAAAFAKELLSVVPAQEVEQMPAIKRLEDRLEGVSITVNELRSQQKNQEDQAILDWLTKTDYSTRQNDFIQRRQKGTGDWVLNSEEFQRWQGQNKHTLYCPGIPGAGKTMIASIVIDHLSKKFRDEIGVVGIAYIFCDFRQQQEQRVIDVFLSLLRQFVERLPSIPEKVTKLYEDHETRRTRPSLYDVTSILSSVIASYSRAFIIIDALDEFSNEILSQLLDELFGLQTKTGSNIFTTSRPILDLPKTFGKRGSSILNISASDDDIEKYLDGHMSQIPFLKETQGIEGKIKSAIIKAADGMFLLAKLHLDSLEDKTSPREMDDALERLPKGEDAYYLAYNEAMERIINGQKPGFAKLALRTLSWISCSKRALTMEELQHALAVTDGARAFDLRNIRPISIIVSVCAGLVTVEEKSKIIRLVHYTTQDYFAKRWRDWFPDAHHEITRVCVTYLSFDIFYRSDSPTKDELEKRLNRNVLYGYAVDNWGYHASQCVNEGKELISDFLKDTAKVSICSQAMIYHKLKYMETKMTRIHLAAYFGLLSTIIDLIEGLDDVNSEDSHGQTPLLWATRIGHAPVVKLLLEKNANIESKDSIHGQTPLLWAARRGYEPLVKLLLEKHANIESKDKYGQTPLSQAAETGQESVVKLLLKKKANIESRDSGFGQTPLSWAADNGHRSVVKLLLERNADTDSKDKYGHTPLSYAAKNGHEAVIKLLLEKHANIESKDKFGQTPLSQAAETGRESVVKLLLKKNADIESKSDSGRTPLSWAAEDGHESVVKLLLERNADTESRNKSGHTPLSYAAENGHEAVVKLLLKKNAAIESKNEYGHTPLSYAAKYGHETIVKLLLTKNADIESKNNDGHTPLSLAAQRGHEPVVRLLLEKNADIESKSDSGLTPLLRAARSGHEPVVKLLLGKNADIESKSNSGRTSLSLAAGEGYRAVVKLLLEKNANIESKSKSGQTPLSWAAKNGRSLMVKFLLEKKANIESKDKLGRTPLSWASDMGRKSVVKILLEKNANIESKSNSGQTPLSLAAKGDHTAVTELIQQAKASQISA